MDRNGDSDVAYVIVNKIKMVLSVTAIIIDANPIASFPCLMLFSEFSVCSYSSPNGLKNISHHLEEFQHSSILSSFVFV